MKPVNVGALTLQNLTSPLDATVGVNFAFPVSAASGATNSSLVYFEIEPGRRLPMHHDGQEEVLFVVQGAGAATIGDSTLAVRAGDLAVVPAWVPHGVVNTGDTTLKVVGFFGSAVIAHLFAERIFPGEGSFLILHTPEGESAHVAHALQPVVA
jgi:mannose-6-phosphate isomerase-like protein (cupin superfamily)